MTKYELRKFIWLDDGEVAYTVDPLGQVFNESLEKLAQSMRLVSGDEFLRDPEDEVTTISVPYVKNILRSKSLCVVSPVTGEELARFVRAYRDEQKRPLSETKREFIRG